MIIIDARDALIGHGGHIAVGVVGDQAAAALVPRLVFAVIGNACHAVAVVGILQIVDHKDGVAENARRSFQLLDVAVDIVTQYYVFSYFLII